MGSGYILYILLFSVLLVVLCFIPLSSLSIVWMFIPNFTVCSVEGYIFFELLVVLCVILIHSVSSVDVYFYLYCILVYVLSLMLFPEWLV